jgi:hypothetical protein
MKSAALLALLLTHQAFAEVRPYRPGGPGGGPVSAVRIDYSSTLGGMSASDGREAAGERSVILRGSLSLAADDDDTGPNFLDATATFDLLARHDVEKLPDEFLRVTGSIDASVSFTHSGSSGGSTNPATSVSSTGPGSQTSYLLIVADVPEPVTLTGNIAGTPVAARIVLEIGNPIDGYLPIHQADTVGPVSFSGFLAPGTYRIRAEMDTDAATGASGQLDFDLAVGTQTEPIPFPKGEYSYPAFGSDLIDSGKLDIVSPSILSQVPQGNGTTLVTVTAGLSNISPCPWHDVAVEIPATFPGGPGIVVQPAHAALEFTDIAANATANPDPGADTIEVLVPDADLAVFNASILSGERFTTSGRELWVFYYPVKTISHPWAFLISANGGPHSSEFVFYLDQTGSYPPGILVIENPLDPFPPLRTIVSGSYLTSGYGGVYAQGDDEHLPCLVTVSEYDEMRQETFVGGKRVTFADVIKHGTVVDTIETPHPSGFDVSDGFTGAIIARNHPIHFNRVPIGDAIELSGSLFFKPGPMGVRLRMEDGVLTELTCTGEFDAGYTLLLETKLAADNTGEPLAAQETTLFSVPLFSVALPSGFQFTPVLSMDLGAAVSATTALTIPIESQLHLEFTAGMKDGLPFYEESKTSLPPTLSPPALFQQLEATATAWIKPELLLGISGSGLVGGGPTVGAKLRGTFGLDPGDSPWWSLAGDLDVLAGLEVQGLNLFTIADAEKVIKTYHLFDFDSGAPPAAARTIVLPDNPGIRPEEGKNTRWARVSRYANTSNDDNRSFVFPVPGTTDLIAGGPGDLARYGADGTLKWALYPPFHSFIDAVPEDDEGFTVLADSSLALYRCDASGNRLWLTHLMPASGSLFPVDLSRRIHPVSGDPEYLVTGWFREAGSRDALVVIKFDNTGTLLWSKKLAAVPVAAENTDANALSASLTAAGDLLVTGFTSTDLAGATPIFNTPGKPLLVKLSGDDGSILWTSVLASHRGGSYRCAIESPSGDIYAAGECAVTVLDDIPPMTLSKFAADGTLQDSLLLGSASAEGASEVAYDQGPVPNGGETPFDVIRDMIWIDGHLWIAGTIGAGSANFGLSSGQAGFTARLTSGFAVDRFAIHETGSGADAIVTLADAGDGLLACGYTRSVLPWPGGNPGLDARLVMKLPDEGLLRFHDLSAAAQPEQGTPLPAAGSHYIYPRTLAGSDLTSFAITTGPDTLTSYPVAFTSSALTLVAANFPPLPPAAAIPIDHHQLEYVPPQVVADLETYLDYHQVDATEDSDNDAMDASAEFFFGSDPFAFDPVTPLIQYVPDPGGDSVVLTVPRAKLAAPQLPSVHDSENLTHWFLRTDVAADTSLLDGSRDWLHLTLPVIPGQDRRFYQLQTP